MPGNPKVRQDVTLLEDIDSEIVLSMFEVGKSKADICRELGIGRRGLDKWIDENGAKIALLAKPYPKREKQAMVDSLDTAVVHHQPSRSNANIPKQP